MDKYVQYMLVIALAMVAVALPEIAWASEDPCAGVLFCVTEKDISANWIKAAFPDLVNLGGTPPEDAPTGPSTLMGEALKVLNSGALAVGSLVLTYKLFAGIVQTANDGEVLGKRWSTLWGPVRVAGSAALIVPTASGYCLAQALVVSIALTGVGLANTVWNRTVDGMLTSSGSLIAPAAYGHYESIAEQVFANNMCLHMANYYIIGLAAGGSDDFDLGELDADSWGGGAQGWAWANGGTNLYSASAGATEIFPSNPLFYRHAEWLDGGDVGRGSHELGWTPVGRGSAGFLNRWFGTEIRKNACGAMVINTGRFAETGTSFFRQAFNWLSGNSSAEETAEATLQSEIRALANNIAVQYANPLRDLAKQFDPVTARISGEIISRHVMPADRTTLDALRNDVSARLRTEGVALLNASYTYGNAIRTNVQNVVQSTFGTGDTEGTALANEFRALAKDGGWVVAGEWFLQLMKLNGVMQNMMSLQPVEPTDVMDINAICKAVGNEHVLAFWSSGCDSDTEAAFREAMQYVETYYKNAILEVGRTGVYDGTTQAQYQERLARVMGTSNELEAANDTAEYRVATMVVTPFTGFLGGLFGGATWGELIGSAFGTASLVAAAGDEDTVNGAMAAGGEILLRESGLILDSGSTNPISAVIGLGRALWSNGMIIMLAADSGGKTLGDTAAVFAVAGDDYMRSAAVSGLVETMRPLGENILGMFRSIGQMMLFPGLLLGYIFPFLPWLLWIGGLVGWFILVIEAVVAAPLWALAHMRMDGEGIMGPAGQQGYMLALSLLLRPALMIIGMLAGMMLIYIFVPFLGMSIGSTMTLAQSSGAPADLMSTVITTALMAFVTVVTCYKAFGLINDLPDRVLRWIGSGSGGAGEDEFKSGAFAIIQTGAITSAVSSASGKVDKHEGS